MAANDTGNSTGSGNSTTTAGNTNPNDPTTSFISILVLALILGLVLFLLFSYLRRKHLKIYYPRLFMLKEEFTLGKYAKAFFSWVMPAFRVSDDEVFAKAGLDAVVYLRFLKLCCKITLCTMPFGILVLIPINAVGEVEFDDFLTKISMSNIGKGSPKLWAHWVGVWVYTLLIFYLFHLEWKAYINYRQKYLSKGLGKQFGLLVTNIPNMFNDDEALKSHLDSIFPDKVFGVHVIRDYAKWGEMIMKHDELVRNWEHAKAVAEQSKEKEASKGESGNDKNSKKIVKLETDLEALQKKLEEEKDIDRNKKNSAFVFFKSLHARTVAMETTWSEKPFTFNSLDMPDRGEVAWGNLGRPVYQVYIRKVVARVIVYALVFFYTIPIAFIATLANLKSIAEYLTFLEPLANSTGAVTTFIQGLLPVILLAVFKILLPIILRAIARFEGQVSESSIDIQAFKDLIIFDFVNTFFVFVLSGSIFQNLKAVAEQPLTIPTLLAKALPNQANFFMNLVILAAFFGNGMEMSRIVPLIVRALKLKLLAKTRREKYETWRPINAPYMKLFSVGLLFFLIGISYSVLSPIVVVFNFLYYFIAFVVWKNQLLRVYVPVYEHEGRYWPLVFSRMMVAVLIFQLLMIGVFSLKGAYTQLTLLAPLAGVTVIFWSFMSNHYDRVTISTVLKDPSQLDDVAENILKEVQESYQCKARLPSMQETSSDRYEYGAACCDESKEQTKANGSELVLSESSSEIEHLSTSSNACPLHARALQRSSAEGMEQKTTVDL